MAEQDGSDQHGTSVLSRLEAVGLRLGAPVYAGRPSLHAIVTSAGYEERTSDYDWHGLKRGSAEFCLFQYTLAGRGQLAFAGTRHTVLPGQAMLLWFPHDNRYWLASGDRWRHFYLCLAGREVMRAWRAVIARRGPLVPLAEDSPALAAAADAAIAGMSGTVRDPWTSSALAYRLAMALCAELLGDPGPERRHPAIEAAKRHGRARFADGLGVSDLARAAGMTRHHFARTFAKAEGNTPSQWLADLRAREATRLLRETNLTVAAIGSRCGYQDAAYFCRAFRRIVGVSPGEFRTSGMF
ncbi:MAG: AraC family transcriptional regulator [Gemmatimonadota bacterium]|nr:AraC family transcriptional regulator [Gemmatimonadota bacterium]